MPVSADGWKSDFDSLALVKANSPNVGSDRESVDEFLAFFIEYVRKKPEMLQILDQALKDRYGPL